MTFHVPEENLIAKTPDRRSMSEQEKSQDPDYIHNPESGRYVLKTGTIGRKLLQDRGEQSKSNEPPSKPTEERNNKHYKINRVSNNFHQTRLSDHYPNLKQESSINSNRRYQINLLNHHRDSIERSERHELINLGREIRQELVTDQQSQTYQRSAETDDRLAEQKMSKANKDSQRRYNLQVEDNGKMYIYTDGAVSNNGQQSKQSRGGVGVFFGLRDERNISERFTRYPITNQRAEVWAIVRALQVIVEHNLHLMPEVKIVIFTDSMYSLNVITGEWNAKDNLDLIGEAWKLLKQIPNVNLKHVKAHLNSKGNIMADKLAQNGKLRD